MKKILKFVLVLVVVIALAIAMSKIAYAADDAAGESPPNFWAYITEKAYVLIPVLYFMGFAFKKIPKIPDWLIPFLLVAIGIPAGMALVGWNIDGCIQGVLVTGATVFINQSIKQGIKGIAGGG